MLQISIKAFDDILIDFVRVSVIVVGRDHVGIYDWLQVQPDRDRRRAICKIEIGRSEVE
jgi:hypothetical protein